MRSNIVKSLQTYIKIQDVIAILIVVTVCALAVMQRPATPLLETGFAAALGYAFARATNGVAKAK
jgi:hypothetical protein